MAEEPGGTAVQPPVGIIAVAAIHEAIRPQIFCPMWLGFDDDREAISCFLSGQRSLLRWKFPIGP